LGGAARRYPSTPPRWVSLRSAYAARPILPRPLQRLFEDLRVALVVVQRGARHRQALDAAGLETAFLEPVRGAGGEHEQGLQAHGPGAFLDAFQQLVASPAVAVLGIDRQAGHLAGIRVGDRVERGAGDDQAVALDDAELLDLEIGRASC